MTGKIIALLMVLLTIFCGCTDIGFSDNSSTSEEGTEQSSSTDSSQDDTSENESVEEILQRLTLEEKIGQMLMLSIRSWENNPVQSTIPEDLEKAIKDYSIGNIILFAENLGSVDDTVKLTHSLQNALEVGIPMFISADQEGGNVSRLSFGCSLIGNMALGALGDENSSNIAGKITGEQLYALGINLNLAPTLDVNNNPQNPVINVRSFSENPQLVAKLGSAMIKGIQSQNVSACAKHFPGHGDTTVDSHYGLPCVNKTYEEIKNCELVPFQAAVNAGIDMIMTAHIQFPLIESTEKNGLVLPSTLSKKMLTDILKGDMGFEGVVITDSMQMDAISDYFSMEEASILAINAGVDILLMPIPLSSNGNVEKLDYFIKSIKTAVESGEISEERINDAVKRILTAKKERNLWKTKNVSLDEKIQSATLSIGNPEHKKIERELAAKSVTVLENNGKQFFSSLATNGKVLFFVPSEDLRTNVRFALNRLKTEGKANVDYQIKTHTESNDVIFEEFDAVILLTDTTASWNVGRPLEIYQKALEKNKKVAVISCRLPYDTALFTLADYLLVCYCPKGGEPRQASSAFGVNVPSAIEVLFGISEGKGALPVTVYQASQNGTFDFSKIVYPLGYNIENK